VGDANIYFGSEDHLIYSVTRGGGYIPGRSWTLRTGGRVSSPPLVYGDRIFVGSGDYKLYCLEDVGAEPFIRWAYSCGASIARRPFAFRDWVFAVTQESRPDSPLRWNLACLGAVKGDPRWEAANITDILAADSIHCYGLDTSRNIVALRLDTGQVDWILETSGFAHVLGQDARLGSDKAWWGRMFLIGSDGMVQAIRPRR
jgi:outer membrane protein assembly factor BamB